MQDANLIKGLKDGSLDLSIWHFLELSHYYDKVKFLALWDITVTKVSSLWAA